MGNRTRIEVNVGSHRFYERHGFVLVELTDGRDNEEEAPDRRYRWPRCPLAARHVEVSAG